MNECFNNIIKKKYDITLYGLVFHIGNNSTNNK